MPNDMYEEYRTPLTQEEQVSMQKAEGSLAALEKEANEPNSQLIREPNGFRKKISGEFILNPVTVEHMNIAVERAYQQFKNWENMPESIESSVRYPGVDPIGKSSVIDMRMAEREAKINATLESRSPEVQEYARSLLLLHKIDLEGARLDFAMTGVSVKHKAATRASKLCLDPVGRDLLHQQSRVLESDQAVEQYDLYMQGVEFAAGVRTGPVPQEVQDLYSQRLKQPLNLELIKKAAQLDHTPRELKVEFQNLDHKLLQEAFADPKNWGKSQFAAEKTAITADQASQSIVPYARATTSRLLDPLYNNIEGLTGTPIINRADNIIVDGKTVRERMYEDFVAAGNSPQDFYTHFQQNYKTKTNEYVAGALMAGKRVEAFIPGKDGRVPDEPMQITKTGYEPSPVNAVTLNAWERFWSKRGFYKEKAKAAVEYQRTMEARERVKSTNLSATYDLHQAPGPYTKDPFFSNWVKENGPLPETVPHSYSVTRSALTTTAACLMAAKGYPVEDIFDPTKLQNEKQQIGSEVVNRMKAGDQKWMGEVLFHGQRVMCDYIDQKCQTINVLDDKQLFHDNSRALFCAASTCFDASQETSHCKEEYEAAAGRYSPPAAQTKAQLDNRVNSSGLFFNAASESLKARNELTSGLVNPDLSDSAVRSIVNFEAARAAYKSSVASSPQTPMTQRFSFVQMYHYTDFYTHVDKSAPITNLTKQLEDPEAQREMGLSLNAGLAQKRLHFTFGNGPDDFRIKIDSPSLQEKMTLSTNRDMQEIARQNASKSMGGRAK